MIEKKILYIKKVAARKDKKSHIQKLKELLK